jgi:hypothetical protein
MSGISDLSRVMIPDGSGAEMVAVNPGIDLKCPGMD